MPADPRVEPDDIDDGRASWWSFLDVTADPTSAIGPPVISVSGCREHVTELTVEQARRIAAHLIAAADFCEGGA